MKPNCIDVSTWNGAVDYHKVNVDSGKHFKTEENETEE